MKGPQQSRRELRCITKAIAVSLVALIALVLPQLAKAKKAGANNKFDAPAAQVYDAVYRYAQHNGTIKWADEKRLTLSGVIFVPGGKWDWQKNFDCTISVEPSDGGKQSFIEELATVTVKSLPDGADITMDEKFVGSTPSTLRLLPGDHAVSVQKSGFKNWERTIAVTAGGAVMVSATLERN